LQASNVTTIARRTFQARKLRIPAHRDRSFR
jgi:hypothetical protein